MLYMPSRICQCAIIFNKKIFGCLELHIEIFYWYLYVIQGFSERLVTTSRPAIGLMFKQVGIPYSCSLKYIVFLVLQCFSSLKL